MERSIELAEHDRKLIACRNYVEFLQLELQLRMKRNKKYSLRAMARDLEISYSHMSEVLSGKAGVGPKLVKTIAQSLNRPPLVIEYFLLLMEHEKKADKKEWPDIDRKVQKLRLEHQYMPVTLPHRDLDRWTLKTLSVLLLAQASDSLDQGEQLAQRVGLSLDELDQSLKELTRLGLIEPCEHSNNRAKYQYMSLGDKGAAYEIKNLHRKALKEAERALDKLSYEERFFNTTIYLGDPKRLPEIYAEIREFVRHLAEKEEAYLGPKEVCVIGAYLLPLTMSSPK